MCTGKLEQQIFCVWDPTEVKIMESFVRFVVVVATAW